MITNIQMGIGKLFDGTNGNYPAAPIDLFLSAGQSNESGRGSLTGKELGIPQVTSFANDYKWKQLEEPTDDPTGQVDSVSSDAGLAGHSNVLKAAKDLYAVTQRKIAIVPASKGGASTSQWQPPVTRFDRTTLFGSADYRLTKALEVKQAVLKAILWMQGEGDAGAASSSYIANHTAIIAKFREYYGSLPVFYNQLAVYGASANANNDYQVIREKQRLMETGSGNVAALALNYMAVTHDLPMNTDILHLTQAAQIELGRRRALAIRQYLYGHAVNGTGPRLVSISKPTTTTVKVKTTVTINDHNNYDNYFTVYDNAVAATISSISRDPGDNTAVLITLAPAPAGTVTVEYKPPYNRAQDIWMVNVVKDSSGLPLPAFGPIGLF